MTVVPDLARSALGERAAVANAVHYGAREDPNAHFKSRYHRVRLQIAAALLLDSLATTSTATSGAPTVLELGAGAGTTAQTLAAAGLRVIASDVVDNQLPEPPPAGVTNLRLDASREFPVADESIDAVFAGELIEHLFDTRDFLDEIWRVLRPGGVLVLTTPNLAGLQDRLRFLLGRAPRQIDPLHPYLYLHIRGFTARSLRRTLRETGFRDHTLRSNFVAFRWKSGRRLYLRTPARLLPGLGGSLIVSAHKGERA
jgi:SAM-dependent methyltransferase